MSEEHDTKIDGEILTTTIVHLAKSQRWNDLKIVLKQNHFSNETNAIICTTFIEKLFQSLPPNVQANTATHSQIEKIIDYAKDTILNKHALQTFFVEDEKGLNQVDDIDSTYVRLDIPGEKYTVENKFGKANQQQCTIIYENDNPNSKLNNLEVKQEVFNTLLTKGKIKLKNNIEVYTRCKAWLSCDLTLDELKNKEQYFTISGWINVIWKEPKHSPLYKSIKHSYYNHAHSTNIWNWDKCMRINDLRETRQVSYYLPIDPTRIFDQTSVKQAYQHRSPPYLTFDSTTGIVRTEYNITASLSEHFELFWFPFDKQFLNIKIRWNVDHYHILHWVKGKDKDGIPHIPLLTQNSIDIPRQKLLFYDRPLKVNVIGELRYDLILHEPWIGMKDKLTERIDGLRFALIRLRFTRNPMYHAVYILFPIFIVVLCGFSVYAIPMDDVAGRLELSLTVLLIFTAFQSIMSEHLPNTAELLFLDYYLLFAYLLQFAVILSVSYPFLNASDAEEYDVDKRLDELSAKVLFIAWMVLSITYIFGGMLVWFMYRWTCCCCGDVKYRDTLCRSIFWEKRSKDKFKQWRKLRNNETSFEMRIKSDSDHEGDVDVVQHEQYIDTSVGKEFPLSKIDTNIEMNKSISTQL